MNLDDPEGPTVSIDKGAWIRFLTHLNTHEGPTVDIGPGALAHPLLALHLCWGVLAEHGCLLESVADVTVELHHHL